MKNYQIIWCDDEQTIVLATYPEHWEWDDFYVIRKDVHAFIDNDESNGRVDFIADVSSSYIPKGSPFAHIQTIIKNKHVRVHLIVLVTQHQLIHGFTRVASRLFPNFASVFHVTDTVENAIAFIHNQR